MIMLNIQKTMLLTGFLVVVSVLGFGYLGLNGVLLSPGLNPGVSIGLILIALFLIIEGFFRIYEHKNVYSRYQITRALRVAIGFGILTLEILGFVY